MAKIVTTRLQGKTARQIGAKGAAVTIKRVAKNGGIKSLRTLDAGSDSFGRDLTWVFGANVRKAREENKRVTGAPDRVPDKS